MIKIIIYLFLSFTILFAKSVGIIKNFKGDVKIKRDSYFLLPTKGFELKEKDLIITSDNGLVGIVFKDGSRLSLGANSIFSLKKYLFSPKNNKFNIDLKLNKGKAVFSSGKIGKLSPKSLKFEIPQGTIAIRGTKFAVEAN